ncbi:MAG TPA: glycosyltransferase, partial [Longilinea sp.]|nr:glycosyltransferase [Longilinea sp.]
MPEKTTVSIIIPTSGKLDFLQAALSSLDGNLDSGVEILIIDNTQQEIQRFYPLIKRFDRLDLHVIQEPRNGLHFARHAGARAARGELLAYIDDDVICPKGWLENLIRPFIDPTVGCVGGKTIGKFAVTPPEWVKDYPGYFSLLDLGDTEREILFPQETLFGCNFCIRKNVLMEVGGFNPDGFSNPEYYWQRGDGETGLERKIAQTAWRMVYSPSAWLFHQIPQTRLTRDFLIRRAQTQAVSDSFTYYRTHPGLFPLAKGLGLS